MSICYVVRKIDWWVCIGSIAVLWFNPRSVDEMALRGLLCGLVNFNENLLIILWINNLYLDFLVNLLKYTYFSYQTHVQILY